MVIAPTSVSAGNQISNGGPVRNRFPHLSEGDRAVWERFLGRGLGEWDRYEYDVTLRSRNAGEISEDDWIKLHWGRLRSKRIDVVGWRENVPTVIEVKPFGSMSGLGQLLVYRRMFGDQLNGGKEPEAVCVCELMDADLELIFPWFGVRVIEVGV